MSLAFNIGKLLDTGEFDRDNYFKILGCSENSTDEQITAEYRIRALKCHPDKNPGDEGALQEFQTLQEARDILTNPELRKHYDKWRQSEMCIPFKTWLNMHNRCATTMHWAKPKAQTMLEGRPEEECPGLDEFMMKDEAGPADRPSSEDLPSGGIEIQRKARSAWESDSTSSVYQQFRNYKI